MAYKELLTDIDCWVLEIARDVFVAKLPSCKGDAGMEVKARWDALHHAQQIVAETLANRRFYLSDDPSDVRKALVDAMEEAEGNITAAARILDVTTQTVYNRLYRYGLSLGKQVWVKKREGNGAS